MRQVCAASMNDGGDEENAGGLSSTQLEQLESKVMEERLLARLSPGSQEEPLPTTETEGELRAVRGSWVPGGYSRARSSGQ